MQGSTVVKLIAAAAAIVFISALALMVYRTGGATVNWQIGAGDPVQNFYPAGNGLYVIGSSHVSLVNGTGRALWAINFTGIQYSAYGNGALYVYSADRGLNVIYPDGTVKALTKQDIDSPPVVGPDGTLYLRARDLLTAISPSGDEKWNVSGVVSGPVVDGSGNVYFFMRPAGRVSDIYLDSIAPDGRVRWSTYDDRYSASTGLKPASTDGVFVYDEPAGVLYQVNESGNIAWDHTMAYLGQYDLMVDEKSRLYLFYLWGTVHVVTERGNLVGKFNPVMTFNANLSYCPAVYNDTIYVIGDKGKDSAMLYALDLDGSLRWEQQFNSSAVPAIYAGRGVVCVDTEAGGEGRMTPVLYVFDDKGSLKYRYDSGDGRRWQQVRIAANDTVYARTYGGILYALKG